MRPLTDVLVVGAGPAGLSAGYLLARHGREVMLVDRDPASVVGGARETCFRGFRVDGGDRRPLSRSQDVRDIWDEIQDDTARAPSLWEAAAAGIRAAGGTIRLGEALHSAPWDISSRIWTVSTVDAEGGERTITARHLVWSAPLTDLTAALRPVPISRLHARRLRHRDLLTVVLVARAADGPREGPAQIDHQGLTASGVRSFGAGPAEAGMVCLGLDYVCFEGDELCAAPDAALVALAKREAGHIGLMRAEEVVDACVMRQAKAYPVQDEEYEHNMRMIRLDLERSYPTLHLVGRNGLHQSNDQDQATMTALLAVRNILDGKRTWDVWRVHGDAEYGTGHPGALEGPAGRGRTSKRTAA